MISATLLTVIKEFRLLIRDPVGLFMLIVAPIAVISAAGFSLANIYGADSSSAYGVAVVDEDGGEIARAIVDALGKANSLRVIRVADRRRAEAMVRVEKSAVVAIVIPAGVTHMIESGSLARLVLFTDPVRYLLTVKVELVLGELLRRINTAVDDEARTRIAEAQKRLVDEIAAASESAEHARADSQRMIKAAAQTRAVAEADIQRQVEEAIANAKVRTDRALDEAVRQLRALAESELTAQRAILTDAHDYLLQLQQSEKQFELWFEQLKQLAGRSRASSIPAPPSFPKPPPRLLAAGESGPTPPDFAQIRSKLEHSIAMPDVQIQLPELAPPPVLPGIPRLIAPSRILIPGTLGFSEIDLNGREIGPLGGFNAFDLQVPGFAVTFLLIGMLMGVSLALIDEREWGTLDRLRATAAPVGAIFAGKLLARFVVGFLQMAVLFAAGRAMFGISLGTAPAALALPCAAIAFAGSSFGLIVAGVGRTRDAVLPVGAIVIMTMAAIGGCWWPIDFEPQWMQTAALAVPTTWAMRAFNDLMIRRLDLSSALLPSAVNLGFGFAYMLIGIAITRRRFTT